jgi:transposase-like protein
MTKPDPMLSMLEWLCDKLMEAEISAKIGADKSEHSTDRQSYRSGYRPRRFDTRMGTIYLMVPKIRQGGYVPFFVSNRKRSEAALIQVVQEAFVNGVSTRKMERLAKSLGIENLSRSQVSNMAKELDEQVENFRNRSLNDCRYPVLWVDALYEKVRFDGRVVSMAILLVCGVNEVGTREVLAIEPMLEESRESYSQLFAKLKERGLQLPSLIISDAHAGLVSAIREAFPGHPGSAVRCISCAIFL